MALCHPKMETQTHGTGQFALKNIMQMSRNTITNYSVLSHKGHNSWKMSQGALESRHLQAGILTQPRDSQPSGYCGPGNHLGSWLQTSKQRREGG